MKGFRPAASKLARSFVYYGGLSRVLTFFRRQPRILMLHGVGTPEFPPSVFRDQLFFLNRFFRIVPLDHIWEASNSEHTDRPKLALTFDDGLRNNFVVAYPILREFQTPATFFVCPGLISSGRWLWNHDCRARLAWLSGERRQQFAKSLRLASDEIELIIQELKNMPNGQRLQVESELRKDTPGFLPTEQQRQRFDIMSWRELKAIDRNLITIGGHSTNHEILPQLDSTHLEREVADCRHWLEQELSRPVLHFCYPDGAYNSQVLSCVGRNFLSAVTTQAGWVPLPPSLLELPRIAIPFNLPDLAWCVQRPTS